MFKLKYMWGGKDSDGRFHIGFGFYSAVLESTMTFEDSYEIFTDYDSNEKYWPVNTYGQMANGWWLEMFRDSIIKH